MARRCIARVIAGVIALSGTVAPEAGAQTSPPTTPAHEKPHVRLFVVGEEDDLTDLLEETLGDLGFAPDLALEPPPARAELLAWARERDTTAVIVQRRARADGVTLRVIAAHPQDRFLRTREGRVSPHRVSVQAVVMMRDVVVRSSKASTPTPTPITPQPKQKRSEGRFILATHGTLYGGFLGYSLQRAAGSDDPRLLYPLMAVGAGIGLGAALIVTDEWEVGQSEAWYLVGGTWWPAVAAHLIHGGRFPDASAAEAWQFGLIGSGAGVALASVGLLDGGMNDGGAVLAHSGGAGGLVIGGLTELAVTGDTETLPLAGLGYGAAGGWLLASASATLFRPNAVDVLILDLGGLLGGLAGASAASPLLFEKPTVDKTRGWVGATGGGIVAGTVTAAFFLPDGDDAARAREPATGWRYVPQPSLVGQGPSEPGEIAAPGYGLTWRGPW